MEVVLDDENEEEVEESRLVPLILMLCLVVWHRQRQQWQQRPRLLASPLIFHLYVWKYPLII